MILNASNLQTVYVAFNGVFQKAYQDRMALAPLIATEVPTTGETGEYGWLGALPLPREWKGSRHYHRLAAHDYAIKNLKHELTVTVKGDDIRYDRVGLYKPMFEMLGQRCKQYPDKLVFQILTDGFTTAKAYDGKTFFATNHVVNKANVSNRTNAALSATSFNDAYAALLAMKDEGGVPFGFMPTHLFVSPQGRAKGQEIVVAERLPDGGTNTNAGVVKLIVVPWWTSTTQWILACCEEPLKPVLLQVNEKMDKIVRKDRPEDENVFDRDELIYGSSGRFNVGVGFWQMAYGSTGDA